MDRVSPSLVAGSGIGLGDGGDDGGGSADSSVVAELEDRQVQTEQVVSVLENVLHSLQQAQSDTDATARATEVSFK